MSEMSRAPLDTDALVQRLGAVGFASVTVAATTGSTNDDATARLRGADRLPGMEVFLADEQTSGRGRRDRVWVSPPRSQIMASVAVQLSGVSPQQFVLLPLLAGVSIAEGISEAMPELDIALKWPNDVLVDGHKLSGILVEAVDIETEKAVIGFGINYDLTREELPVPHAASLLTASGGNTLPVSREDVAVAVLLRLAENLERFQTLGGSPVTVLGRYRRLCATLGAQVSVDLGRPAESQTEESPNELSGTAVDVGEAGELIIDTGRERIEVTVGDVHHMRRVEDVQPSEGVETTAKGYA